jgi:SAM-dependent methyltransferase
LIRREPFPGSAEYWRRRYATGGDSGAGSYSKFGSYKARVLNAFVLRHGITKVIEFGCGDGNQLSLATYDTYVGVDISEEAIRLCRERFSSDSTKTFQLADNYTGERAELSLSLDVVYHLVEDDVFENYMTRLFDAAERYVIIYSSDTELVPGERDPHVRHRRFSEWVTIRRPDWIRIEVLPNPLPYRGNPLTGTFAEFHVFARDDRGSMEAS